ncbi:MAG: GNAT family N-acetyltransferase [Acidobacteria bacterium]|nr:MAG: GNAT family N-acetyltransferase [Acidobacteriota bacterium]
MCRRPIRSPTPRSSPYSRSSRARRSSSPCAGRSASIPSRRCGPSSAVQLVLQRSVVRSWRASDAESIARYANNRNIWINLRDAFPHPYTLHDARDFIRAVRSRSPETTFAIALQDEAVGSIGFVLHHDVERVSVEIGYWLAEPFWGRGIVTEALRAMTTYAIEHHGLTRIYAVPFAWNAASCRVLEKAGYVLDAVHSR